VKQGHNSSQVDFDMIVDATLHSFCNFATVAHIALQQICSWGAADTSRGELVPPYSHMRLYAHTSRRLGIGLSHTHTQGGTHSRHRTHSMSHGNVIAKCKACIPDRVPIDTTRCMCSPRRVSQPLLPACPPLGTCSASVQWAYPTAP
jgi:hypothetical protein